MTEDAASDATLVLRVASGRFRADVVRWPPGVSCDFDPAAWRGALVVVASGCVAVTWSDGRTWLFARDDVLWLDGLPVRRLANAGAVDAVVLRIRRPDAMCR